VNAAIAEQKQGSSLFHAVKREENPTYRAMTAYIQVSDGIFHISGILEWVGLREAQEFHELPCVSMNLLGLFSFT